MSCTADLSPALPMARPAWLRHPLRMMAHLLAIRAERRSLCALDPHLLRDIGVSDHEAMAEAEKPLWNAPRHWSR